MRGFDPKAEVIMRLPLSQYDKLMKEQLFRVYFAFFFFFSIGTAKKQAVMAPILTIKQVLAQLKGVFPIDQAVIEGWAPTI